MRRKIIGNDSVSETKKCYDERKIERLEQKNVLLDNINNNLQGVIKLQEIEIRDLQSVVRRNDSVISYQAEQITELTKLIKMITADPGLIEYVLFEDNKIPDICIPGTP